MPIKLEAVLGRNITLLYDSLDLQLVDRNKFRELAESVPPTIMDTPEMVVAVYPPDPWFIQVGERRIRITLPAETPTLGDFPLWVFATKSYELISPKNSTLIAHGYNFDIGIFLPEQSTQDVLNRKFVGDQERLEKELGGKLVSFMPRVVFKADDISYDLIFEPLDKQRMKVHLNAHFETKTLPNVDSLKKSYIEQFEHLTTTVINFLTI